MLRLAACARAPSPCVVYVGSAFDGFSMRLSHRDDIVRNGKNLKAVHSSVPRSATRGRAPLLGENETAGLGQATQAPCPRLRMRCYGTSAPR